MRKKSYNSLPIPCFSDIYKNFFLICLFYLYLFQPPIISKYFYLGLEVLILIIYVILSCKKTLGIPLNKFKNEILIIVLIIIYAMLRDLFSGQLLYSDRFLAWFFQSFLFGIFVIYIVKKYNQKHTNHLDVITVFYWTTFFAAVFTLLLLLNKDFDNFYQSIELLGDTKSYEHYKWRYRVYGIAENLTFTYSYILGLFAGYTILVIKRNYLLILPFLLFMIGIYFNARIGFFAIFPFLLLSLQRKYIGNLLIVAGFGVVFVYAVSIQIPLLWERISDNSEWVLQAFYDLSFAITGFDSLKPKSSTIEALTGSMIILPETVSQWIFGRGISLFGGSYGMSSDVGYILQLNYGGILFLILIILAMVYFSYRLYKVLGLTHWYFVIFVMSIFLLNMKGFVFAATPGGRLLFFLYCYFVLSSKKEKVSALNRNSVQRYS